MYSMSSRELIQQLQDMDNAQRLEVIATATRLVREDLARRASTAPPPDPEQRLRQAALAVKDLYEDGPLTEWTSLDAEDVLDDGAAQG